MKFEPRRAGRSLLLVCTLVGVFTSGHPGHAQPASVDLRCGAYCLFVAEGLLGRAPASLTALERDLGPIGPEGYSIQQLKDQAERQGIATLVVQADLDEINNLKKPFSCIALLKRGHFVVVSDVGADQVAMIDPPRTTSLPMGTFQQEWTGYALILGTSAIERTSSRRGWVSAVAALAALGVVAVVFARRRVSRPQLAGLLACIALASGCARHDNPDPTRNESADPPGELRVALDRDDLGTILLTEANRRQEVHGSIINDSASDVLIRRVRPGCACTDVKLATSLVRPGQAARFDLTIHPGTEDATRRNTVVFETDRREQLEVQATVRWKTVNPLSADPVEVAIRKVGGVCPPPANVQVRMQGFRLCRECEVALEVPSPLKAALPDRPAAESRGAFVHGDQFWEDGPEAERQGDVGNLSINLEEKVEPCEIATAIDLKVSCRGIMRASLQIPVRVQVEPQVQVAPNRLSLGLASPGSRHSVSLVFRRPDGQPFTLQSVACPEIAGKLTAHHDAGIPRKAQSLKLDLEVPATTGVWRTTVDVTLSTGETLGIPISALIR